MEWQEFVLELEGLTHLELLEEKLQQIMTGLEMPAEKQLDLRLCLLEAIHNGFIHGNQKNHKKK